MRVLPKNEQAGCVFYPRMNKQDACSTKRRSRLLILPRMNKQDACSTQERTSRMRVLPKNEQARLLILPKNEQARLLILQSKIQNPKSLGGALVLI
ncbi:MAG: hypothetical protein ACPGWR_25000 [Ardenticatenaceae bacterium]